MSAPASVAAAAAVANSHCAVKETPPYDAVLHTPFTCLYLAYEGSLTKNLTALLLQPPEQFIAEPQGPPSWRSPQRFHPNPANAAAEDAAAAAEAQRAEAEVADAATATGGHCAADFGTDSADARRRLLTREADLSQAGTYQILTADGVLRTGPLVRCDAGREPGVEYRYAQIVGELSPGLCQCGAEMRVWQRAGSISPHIVQCRYSASELRGPLRLHWFLLDRPSHRLVDYLSDQTTKHDALDVLRMLYGVAQALQELQKLNFIVGPRALTLNNLWVQRATDAMQPPRLLLENGLFYMADVDGGGGDGGGGQWSRLTRLDVVRGQVGEGVNPEDSFTYMQMAYADEAMKDSWRRLARRATVSCMRQLSFLASDLYMCSDSGLDGRGGYAASSRGWDEQLTACERAVDTLSAERGDLKYVGTFMRHCRQAALDTRPEHGGMVGCPGLEGCFAGCCKLLKMLLHTAERLRFRNVFRENAYDEVLEPSDIL